MNIRMAVIQLYTTHQLQFFSCSCASSTPQLIVILMFLVQLILLNPNKKPRRPLPGQTDEGEIGIAYKDPRRPAAPHGRHALGRGGDHRARLCAAAHYRRVRRMIVNSQFKRTMPPIAKLHARTIGIDFRYLRDWNK